MATKAKRTPSSSKPSKKPVKASVKPAAVKPRAAATSSRSKKKALPSFWLRTRFLFWSVLIASALIATIIGLMGYQADQVAHKTNRTTATQGVMFLQSLESDGKHNAGDVVNVTLYEDSGNHAVNALQGDVRYPAEKLELVGVTTGNAFTEEAATNTETPGLVRVARNIKPGTTPVKGAKPVVTIQFKVLSDSGKPFELSIDRDSSLLVRSIDNKNILESSGNSKFEL